MDSSASKNNFLIYTLAAIGGFLFLAGLMIVIYPILFPSEPTTVNTPATPSTPSTPTTPEPDECEYDEFEIRVKSISGDFEESLNLQSGQSFRAYLFEDVDSRDEIQDVDIIVEGAGIDDVIESGERIITDDPGEIYLEAKANDCDDAEAKVNVVQSQQFAGAAGPGAVCGESCNTTSDCIAQGTTGAAVECHQGRCVNSSCKANTVYGTRCDCAATNPCGSPCSAAIGLCGGGSACRYITGPSCTDNADVSNPTRTYCVPTSLPAGYSVQKCVARDTGNSYLNVPEGTAITTALLAQLCSGGVGGGTTELPRTNIEIGGVNIFALMGIGFILIGLMVLIKYRQNQNE